MTADIKLKGKDGTETTYTGVDTIRVPTADGGNANFLLEGTGGETTETEEVNVEPDFSGGNQVVVPDAGKSFSKVTITKPAELLPGNVVSGVAIAGVAGTADSVVNFRTKLFTQYGAGGVVLVQPDLKVIRVYGTYVGGVFPMDSGLKADLGMLKDVKNVAAELHDVLNALGRFIGLAARETFNAIFSVGEAVRIGNVVCGVPSVSGTLAGWNAFADILYGTLSNVSNDFTSANFVPSAAKEFSGSVYQTDYWQAKFPFEWEAVKKSGEKTLAGYHFADISGKTMPIYDSGMYVQSGESGNMVGAVNANEGLGIAADFVAMTGTWRFEEEGTPAYVVIVWYSYGSQTISEAVLKQINSNWSAGDVTLGKGWNVTQSYQQDGKWVYVTGGSEVFTPDNLNAVLGILKKETVPYDNLDDYLKGMFTEVYDQPYKVVDKFLLEFNLAHKSET